MTVSAEDRPEPDAFPPAGPAGMHSSALVLKDEDGNSINTELETWSDYSGDLGHQTLAPAAINVENSSDVIIGPVTQFNGPVTIYQSVNGNGTVPNLAGSGCLKNGIDGKLVKSESTSSDAPPPSERSRKSSHCSKRLKLIVISVVAISIVAIIATATILSLKSTPTRPSPEMQDHYPEGDPSVDEDPLRPAGPGIIIEKKTWGGRPALNWTTPLTLKHPTRFVIISHTATPQCRDFDACAKRVQQIQTFHVGTGKSPDIGYNFLVGTDGNAYVGRGWDMRNFHKDNSIGICFIGNYVYDHLTGDMITIAKKLLEEGVETGKLDKNYALIAHNQTWATESPGPHVYEEIKKWPHFDPKRYI